MSTQYRIPGTTDENPIVARMPRTKAMCKLCESYSAGQAHKPVAVMSCEGACLRGEVARQTANFLCFEELPETTARICLGGAFTKDTGQRGLTRNARRLLALEGCATACASRMMVGVEPGLEPEIVQVVKLYTFDPNLFSINEMAPEEITAHARSAARQIAAMLREDNGAPGAAKAGAKAGAEACAEPASSCCG